MYRLRLNHPISFGVKQESNRPSRDQNLFRNQRGQSVIELVLILIVSVSMLFLAKNMFTGLSDFMNKYMGDYIACLMEYGELPSLGVENADLKNHKEGAGGGKVCDSKFNGFTIASGRNSMGGSGGQSGSAPDSASNKNNSDNADKTGSGADSAANSKNASAGSGGAGRGGSRSGSGSNDEPSRSDATYGTADDASRAAQSKSRVLDEEDDEQDARMGRDRYGSGNSSRVSYRRAPYRAVSGRLQAEIEKSIKKAPRAPSSRIVTVLEEGYRFKAYKKTFIPPTIKEYAPPPEDEGFSFGGFLKWIIIAGIIIAIVILLGSQILNYSNSKDQ